MADKHLKLQKQMMDIYYAKGSLPDEIAQHLESCNECSEFWVGLNKVGSETDIYAAYVIDIEPDNRVIKGAFRQAAKIQDKRKSFYDFVLFLLLAAAVLSIIGLFVAKGYGPSILIAQVVIVIAAPILVPFIIIRRMAKEDR